MDQVHQLEKTIAGWYKSVPHLPQDFTKWLADNMWWLVIIGVVISVFGLLAIVPYVLIALRFSSGIATMYGEIVASGYSTGILGTWLSLLVSTVGLVIIAVLEVTAINPLKAKAKKGWTLLFIVALINLAFNVATTVINIDVYSLVWAVIITAVQGYFLFEIRMYFSPVVKANTKPVVNAKV